MLTGFSQMEWQAEIDAAFSGEEAAEETQGVSHKRSRIGNDVAIVNRDGSIPNFARKGNRAVFCALYPFGFGAPGRFSDCFLPHNPSQPTFFFTGILLISAICNFLFSLAVTTGIPADFSPPCRIYSSIRLEECCAIKGNMEQRACDLALYLIENRTTVRAAARQFGVSKSTVHTAEMK